MSRTRKSNRDLPHPKPVQKIELSEKHITLRSILAVVFLLIGAGFIAYGVSSYFSGSAGWAQIESTASEINCGSDFVFLYCLGESDQSAAAEKRAVTALYSDATEHAFQLFTADLEFEDVHNLYYINRHLNEEIEVDPVLYEAFSLLQAYGDRSIYLAPVYAQYDDLFYCTDDSQASDFDPRLNPEVAASYAEIAAYANDARAVDLELLGSNRIRLNVSEEYRTYAQENSIESLIDFFWLKNAFIADYLADTLISSGYTHGCLSSYDGFIRNLDSSGETYSYNVSDRAGSVVYPAAQMIYRGPVSLVNLRNYGSSDSEYYYTFDNGEIRTAYLDVQDGFCKSSVNDLICYSREQGCAETLLQMIPIYISDIFQAERLSRLSETGVYSIYCQENTILYSDPSLTLTDLYSGEDAQYQTQLIP